MSSLIERDMEVREIAGPLAAASAGEGAVVIVLADPGLGKTSLVEAAGRLAEREGLEVLRARGAELETTFPFGVVRQLFEPRLAALPPSEHATLFKGAAELARPLFEHAGANALPPGGGRFAALHGLHWLAVHLGDRAPLVMLVDDAHWSDAPSLQFLEYLARRVSGVPLTMLLAARSGEPRGAGDALERLQHGVEARVLRPAPLSLHGVAQLTAERFGRAPDRSFCRACRDSTGGNPLFLDELLRELQTEGVQPVAEAAPLVGDVGPDAVARFASSRLERIGPEAVELARAVAVLGDRAELALAASIAGLDPDHARATADRLSEAGILAPSLRLRFVHPIMRAAIYARLTPGERAVRHASAARLLSAGDGSAERVAAHLLLSDPAGDPARVRALVEAARLALARGVPENAAAYLRRALEEPPPADELASVLLECGRAEWAAQQLASAEEHLRTALTRGDEETRGDAALWLSRTLAAQARVDECVAILEGELARAAGEATPTALKLENELLLATRLSPAHCGGSRQRTERFRRRAAGRPRFEALALLHTAYQRLSEGASAAEVGELAERGLALAPLPMEEPAFFWTVRTLLDAEFDETAARVLEVPLDGLQVVSRAWRGPVIALHRAELAYSRGALEDALTEVEVGVASIEAVGGFHMALPRLEAVRVDVLRERGDLREASVALERVGLARDSAELPPYARLLWSRGLLLFEQGRLEEARDDLMRCGELRHHLGAGRVVHPDWRARCAIVLSRLGERRQAEAMAAEQLRLARAFGAPRALGEALRSAGLVRGGSEALSLLEQGVAVLKGSGAPLSLAHVLTDYGAALREAGRRADSRGPLRRALKLAERCGATALARRARGALTVGGGRPPPSETTGVAALTPAERRVATLAARELTNREIAQALFVTEKTVEIHLTSTYRKLGIRSRWQLPAPLGAAGEELLLEIG